MPISRQFTSAWIAFVCLAMIADRTFGQSDNTVEWVSDRTELSTSDSVAAVQAVHDADAESSTRTPIQRDQVSELNGRTAGDAIAPSWTWVWAPVGVAVVLWWIVNRLRSGRLRGPRMLPEGVVISLGKGSIGAGQFVQLIRIGSRVLVVTPGADGLRTLSEIADPQEVERIVSLCLRPDHATSGIGLLFGGRPIRSTSSQESESTREATVRETTHSSKLRTRQVSQSRMEPAATNGSSEVGR